MTKSSLKLRQAPGAAVSVTYRTWRSGFTVCDASFAGGTTGACDTANDSVVTVAAVVIDTEDETPVGANSVTRPEPDTMPLAYVESMRLTKYTVETAAAAGNVTSHKSPPAWFPADVTGGQAGPSYGLAHRSLPAEAPWLVLADGFVSVVVAPAICAESSFPVGETAITSTKDSIAVFSVCTRTRNGAVARGEFDADGAAGVVVGTPVDDGEADADAPIEGDCEPDGVIDGDRDDDGVPGTTHRPWPSSPQSAWSVNT